MISTTRGLPYKRQAMIIAVALFVLALALLSGNASLTPAGAAPPRQVSTPTVVLPSTKPILLTDPVPDPVPDPKQQDVMWFSPTGHTLSGAFLDYWQKNGGLAQFGYPLTEEFTEPGPDNKPLGVQYFERNRFEHHPENLPPSNVLLGLLGTAFHTPDPAASPLTNAQYFQETGHNLSGTFKQYWDTHGGLAVHGYPISEQFQETNPIDHKLYSVQYFQRSRFELHPENAGSPYEVLLGVLGTQLSRQKGYPYGWYPPYGHAADFSWVAGRFFRDGSNCPSCRCDVIIYVQNARLRNPVVQVVPLGSAWAAAKATYQLYGAFDPVVVFGHLSGPGEPIGGCSAGYIVDQTQLNPAK